MIVDWEEGESVAVCDAILVSSHGVGYMQYTDGMLHYLLDCFKNEHRDEIVVAKFLAEVKRREDLEK